MATYTHYNYGLLCRAIAVSLSLHVWLLLQPGMDSQSQAVATKQTLMAMLRTGVEDSPAVVSSAEQAPHARVSHENVSAVKPSTATPPAPSISNATNVRASVDQADEIQKTPGVASEGNLPVADFDEDKKSYLFAIAAEARRIKKYPQRAFAAGWTGTADIRIAVAAGGSVLPPTLQKSSGHADIDNAALAFVVVALKRTAVPQTLRQRSFELILPVSFTINDEQ